MQLTGPAVFERVVARHQSAFHWIKEIANFLGDERDFTETEILVGAVEQEISGKEGSFEGGPVVLIAPSQTVRCPVFLLNISSFLWGKAERIQNFKSHSSQLPRI